MFRTALKFMLFEKSKSIGIVIGIIIAVFLIGQQLSTLGFLTGLMKASVVHSDPQVADIWVVTNQTNNANNLKLISSSFLNKIKSINGVKETYPVVIGPGIMKFDNGQFSNVLLIGSEAPSMVMGPSPESIIAGNRQLISMPQAFSIDINDEKNFRHPVSLNTKVEINGKRARFVAITKNIRGYGTSFLYSTVDNVRDYTNMPSNEVNAIIVSAKDKKQIPAIVNNINSTFPGIRAWTRDDLCNSTVSVILKQSNMGISFGSLVLFAVISGFFIIGLTLYTSTFDRVKDYGTLKAIGATNNYISKLVLLQAFIYGIIGYLLACTLLFGMKMGMAKSGLILKITPGLMIALLFMTLFISMGGSFFAINKLRKIEPASVFK